jgi:hypothetical protein
MGSILRSRVTRVSLTSVDPLSGEPALTWVIRIQCGRLRPCFVNTKNVMKSIIYTGVIAVGMLTREWENDDQQYTNTLVTNNS